MGGRKRNRKRITDRAVLEVLNGRRSKKEIQIVLELLRSALIKNEVSIGLNASVKEIMFFDTKKYLESHTLSGFKVNIENLVN